MNDPINTIIHGDCLTILPQLAAASVNFVLTDPPYITNYKSRDGRKIANDNNDAWLRPAFAERRWCMDRGGGEWGGAIERRYAVQAPRATPSPGSEGTLPGGQLGRV